MRIVKEFTFDSAHNLKWHDGKCVNLHGHTYKMQVGVKGKIDDNGVVIDFGDLKKIVNELIDEKLDHKYLNDFYENPTAELMAIDILKELKKKVQGIYLIRLWETPTSFVEATNEDL